MLRNSIFFFVLCLIIKSLHANRRFDKFETTERRETLKTFFEPSRNVVSLKAFVVFVYISFF